MGSFIAKRRHLRRALLTAALLLVGSGLAVGVGASFADVTVGSGNCIQTVGSSTGVTSTRSGNECVVKFTNVGSTTWTTPTGVTKVRALIVGGGASGNRGIYGVYYGSGGGGGEVKDLANLSVGTGAKTVAVGAGGQGVLETDYTIGSAGTLSQFDSTQARPGQPANNTRTNNAGTIGGTSGSGFLGGNGGADGDVDCNDDGCAAGGGGGAGGAGSALDGGVGAQSNIEDGTTSVMYGAGGGGKRSASYGSVSDGAGKADGTVNANAAVNRGGGGADPAGYATSSVRGGSGGSGVVIIRYAIPTLEIARSADGLTSAAIPNRTPQIQLKDNSGANASIAGVTVTATVTGTGCTISSGESVTTSATGLADFSSLTLGSNTVGNSCTLSYSATGFEPVTQDPRVVLQVPSSIDINSTGTAAVFYWKSNGEILTSGSIVTPTTLQTQLDAGKDAVLKTSNGSITVSSAVTATAVGAGALVLDAATGVTVNASITSTGAVSAISAGTTSSIQVSANITTTTLGKSILLKAANNIAVGSDSASVSLQTLGASAGVGGDINIWTDSDADATTGGSFKSGLNANFNTIGGSTTATTGGGQLHIAGGLDDGGSTVRAGRTNNDGFPDGFARSTANTAIGLELGAYTSNNATTINTGGGRVTLFGYTSSNTDGLAANFGLNLNAGEGQIEMVGKSGAWALQLSRGNNNDPLKTVITSRSALSPAISITGETTATSGAVSGILSGYSNQHSGSVVIQALGAGGVNLKGISGGSNTAIALSSTAVLSASGAINIDAGNKGLLVNQVESGLTTGGFTHFGECPVTSCVNSLVTSSTADFNFVGDRFATFSGSNESTISTSGAVSLVPAVGSTAFTDFTNSSDTTTSRLVGMTFAGKISGLTFGREGDTSDFNLPSTKTLTINGPIRIFGRDVDLSGGLVSTRSGSEIRVESSTGVYLHSSQTIQTAGGAGADVVLWGNKADGGGAVYVANSSCVNTVGSCSPNATQIASGGANIIFGGGSSYTTIGSRKFPSGAAKNDSRIPSGVQIGYVANSLVKIYSGGGDIKFSGGGTGYGILTYGGETLNSGAGKISLTGNTAGAGYQGVRISAGSGNASYISSAPASSGNAIEISGTNTVGTAWATAGVMIYDGTRTTMNANGGGDISITGRSSASTSQNDVYIRYADILASEGDITIDGGSGTVQIDADSVVSNFGSLSTDAVAAKGNITIRGDSILNANGTTKVRTTGDLIVEPSGATWSGTYANTWTSVNTDVNDIRIGKSNGASAQGANVTLGAQTGTGTMQVFGHNVSTAALTTTTNSTADISVTASGTYTNTGAISSTGNVSVTAGDDITVGSGITLSSTGKKLELKSKQDVIFNTTAKTIQTKNGPIVIWGNSDGGTGASAGGCYLDSGNTFLTQGGDFVAAGGATSDATSGYPTGFCKGTQVTSDPYSFGVIVATPITTAGGAISVKGETADASASITQAGIYFEPGSYTVSSGAGVQNWSGRIAAADANPSNNKYGIWMGNNSTKPTVTSTAGDITFFGDATAGTTNQRRGIIIYGVTVSSTDGDIVFEGRANDKTSSYDILAGSASPISTTNGDISYIGSGTASVDLASVSSTSKNFSASATNFDAFSSTSVTATGSVVFESKGDTFATSVINATGNFSTTGLTIASGSSSIRIGKPGNTKNVTLVSALSAGQISVYGADLSVGGSLTATNASGSGVLAKATGNIVVDAGTSAAAKKSISATGTGSTAPITLWSNSDASGTGAINVNSYVDILTVNGDITLAGSATAGEASPTGFAMGNGDNGSGVELAAGAVATDSVKVVSSGSGNVLIKGQVNNQTSYDGVTIWSGVKVSSGTGTIGIFGVSQEPTIAAAAPAVNINRTGGYTTTISTGSNATTAIEISGIVNSATASASTAAGGVFVKANSGTVNISATGSGDISITGKASSGTTNAVELNYTNVTAAGGDITVDGDTKAIQLGYSGGTVTTVFGGSTADSKSGHITFYSDNLSVQGSGSATFQNATGLYLLSKSDSFAAAHTLPTSINFTNLDRLQIGKSTNTANLTTSEAYSIGGDIELNAGTLTVGFALTSTATGGKIHLSANETEISATVTSGAATGTGIVQFDTTTAATPIVLGGTAAANQLDLSDTELDYVTAGTIRIGNYAGTTSGNITVSGIISVAEAKASNLALRTTGTITGNGTIAVKNLGLLATSITFGTSPFGVTGNLAIDATGNTAPTFKNSVDYTPSSVDEIDPNFGTPFQVDKANVPTAGNTLDAYMNVTFNPPPTLTLKDKYGSTLQTTNTLADTTSFTVSLATGSSSLAGTFTETSVDGVVTFDDLKFTSTGANTLTFAATIGSTSITETSGTYDVKAGDPDNLYVATNASGGKSDIAFTTQPVIQIRDSGNNLVALDAAKSLVVTASLTSGTGTLIGDTTIAAVNAVATFTDLGIKGRTTESFTITYTVTYNGADISVDQSAISITYGTAAALDLTTPAAGAANDKAFDTQPVVKVVDSAGNVVADNTATVTVASSAGGTLGTTKSKAAVAGVATFSGVQLSGLIGDYTLTYSSGSLTADTQSLTLAHGVATQVSVTGSSSVVNNTALASQPIVTIKDSSGNTVTSGSDSSQAVTLTATGAEISGTTSMAADQGVANFTGKGVSLKGVVGSKTVTATISSPTTLTGTLAVSISAGAAYKLAFATGVSTPQYNRTLFTNQPIITIQDISGNATYATTTVTATATGANFGDGTSTMSVDVANFYRAIYSGMQLRGTAGSVTISFSAPGLVSVSTQAIQFRATQAIDHLQLELPTSAANDADLTSAPRVTFRDADNNLVNYVTFNGTQVTLSSDDVTLSGTLTGTSTLGEVDFSSAGIKLAGLVGTKTITASTAAGKTGSATIDLTYGVATKLAVYTQPLATTNRATFSVQPVIEVQDSSGNRVADSTAEVTVSTTAGATVSGDTSVAATAGRATFIDLGIYGTAGTRALTFASGSLATTASNVTFTHGAADHITVTAPSALVNGVVPTSRPYATIQDQDGNTVLTGSGSGMTVTFSSSTATLYGDLEVVAIEGVATLGSDFYVAATVGSRSLKADTTSPLTVTGTGSITVQEGAAHHLVITQAASSNVASGAEFGTQPKLRFVDLGNNNITATTSASIAVTANRTTLGVVTGSTTLTGTANQEFSYATNKLKLTGTIGQVTLTYAGTVGSNSVNSATETVTLGYGAPDRIRFVTEPSGLKSRAVMGVQPQIELLDSALNRVTVATNTVTASIADGNASTTEALTGTATVGFTDGLATFTGLGAYGKAVLQDISFTATGGLATIVSQQTMTHGAAARLVVRQQASGAKSGIAFTTQPNLEITDLDYNRVVSGVESTQTVSVAVAGTAATLSGTTELAATSGWASFRDNGLTLTGTAGDFTLNYSLSVSTSVTANQSISLDAGVASQLVVTTPAAGARHAIALTTQPVVEIRDAQGNLVTAGADADQVVTVTASGTNISGSKTATAVDGVATFSGFTISGSEGLANLSYAISSPQSITRSATVQLTYGDAAALDVVVEPTGFANRTDFSIAPQVAVEDSAGNRVANATGNIAVSITAAAQGSTSTLTGTTSVAIANGSATFTGLGKYGSVGTKTLTFESGSLTDATFDFELTHGVATQLVLISGDSTVRAGFALGATTLEIQDQDGNLVDTGDAATARVSVSATRDSGGTAATLVDSGFSAPLTAGNRRATAGEVSFTGLKLEGLKGAHTLTFTVAEPSAFTALSDTQALGLTPGTATNLNVVQQPTDSIANIAFSPVVSVEVRDAWNNRVTQDAAAIKPVLVDAVTVATELDSSKSAVATNEGLVTFTGLSFTKAAAAKLRFDATGLTSIYSSQFTITHGEAHHLAWTTIEPTTVRSGFVIQPTPIFAVRDQWNNPVTTGPATTVTASVSSANSGDVVSIAGATESTAGTESITFDELALTAKAANYKIRFTAANSGKAIDATYIETTSTVAVTFGLPHHLGLTEASASVRAGFEFADQPIVKILDSANNVVADNTFTVTATLPAGAPKTDQVLTGDTSMTAASGVADFSLNTNKLGARGAIVEDLNLLYSATNGTTTLTANQTFDVTPGLAASVRFVQQPTTVKRGAVISPAPTVELLDASGNRVTVDSTTQVAMTVMANGGDLNASNDTAAESEAAGVTAVNGLVTFSNITLSGAPATDGYYLRARLIDTLTNTTSNTFTLMAGEVADVVILNQPSSVDAQGNTTRTGELLAAQPKVELVDDGGYPVVAQNSGSVTVSISSGSGGSLSEGTTTATVANGVAQFAGVKLVGTVATATTAATPYKLKFTFSGIDSDESNALTVRNNVAHHLTATRAPGIGQAGVQLSGDDRPQVEIRDRFNNRVLDDTGSIRVSVAVASGSGTPAVFGSTTVAASSGLATFGIGVGGLTSNTYSFSYAYLPSATVAGTSQTGITITDGDVYQLVATTAPATVDGANVRNKTGEALKVQPVLEFRDQWNNLVEAANGSSYQVVAAIHDVIDVRDRLEGATVSAVNGVVTYSALKLIGRPGQNYTLDFSWTVDNTVHARTADNLMVTHADAHHLTIVTQPASQTSPTGPKTRTGDALAVAPVVEVRDFDDNVVTGLTSGQFLTAAVTTGSGSANAVDGGVTNSDQAEIINGVADFDGIKIVALPNTDQKLTFTGLTFTSVESSAFQLTHAAAAKLAVYQQPCSGAVTNGTCTLGPTAGVLAVQPIAQVQDRFSNPVPDFVGTVTASVTGAGGTLTNSANPGDASLVATVTNGLATFAGLELTGTPGTDYVLNFATAGLTSVSSQAIQVTHSAATQLIMVREPIGAETGELLSTQPVVRIADIFGNTVTADSSTVVSVSASGGSMYKAASQPLTATAVNGVVTFSGLKFRGTPSANYQLSFASGDLSDAVSGDFSVTHAAMSQLVWSVQPTVGQTGEDLTTQPVLIMKDFDDNVITSDNTTVVTATVASGIGGSVRNATAVSEEGVVTFDNLQLVGTPGVDYRLTFTAVVGNTSFSAPASDILTPTHARPAALTMRTPGIESGFLIGSAPSNQPKLYVRDSFGNIATSDNSTVITARIGAGVGGAVSGSTTARAVNGLVDFSGLVVTGTPGVVYTLEFVASTSDSRSFSLLDSTTFTMDKVASATLSYVDQAYVPVGQTGNLVAATFSTDSTASPVFSTTAAASICVVNGSTGEISIRGVGSCPVTMTVPSATYYRTNSVVDTFVISKAQQAEVVISSANNVDFWSTLTPAATGGSSSASGYVFSVDGTCEFIGGKVLPGNAGSDCVLFAFKRGDANYLTSAVTEMTITVNKIAQNPLRIGNLQTVNVGDVELFTTGGSGEGAVAFNIVSAGTAECSIISGASGANILRASASGTCSVQATKAASLNYNNALTPTRTFTFEKQDQVVTFTSTIPMNPVVLGSYTPAATATSGLAVTYSITAGQGAICDFDATTPGKINFIAVGVCDVRAVQAGDSQFNAGYAEQRITVGALNQTITFAEIANKRFNDPGFYLAATSNSGLPVSYQLGADVTACQLVVYPGVGTFVRYTSAGLCEITATQAGNATYLPAPPVTRLFEIAPDFAGKPKVTSISTGNQWYTVSFRAPSYLGGSSVLGYLFEITDTNGDVYTNAACSATAPTDGSDYSCTITGIPNGVAYTAKVAAITRAGMGLYSDVVGPLTPAAQTQGVTNLISYVDIVDASDRSLDELVINFDEPLATDSSVVGYEVYIAPAGTTNYGDPILVSPSANLTTSVLVSSIDGSGSGATDGNTDTASFRSGAAVFRTATFRTAAVSPSPSPSPSATTAPVTGYSVKVVTVTSAPELAPTATDYVTEGVHLGVATPSEPRSLGSDVDDIGGKKINLAWVTPESDGGEAITGYRVRIEGGAEPQTIEIDDETLNYTVSEVQAGRTYVIKIAALNVNGAGAEATVTEIIPAPPAPPVTPTPTPSPTPEETESPRPVKPSPKPSPTDGTGNGGQKPVDTDNDGIENNEDSDIDGDGIPNGEDPDMDGDGIPNGEDPDPTDTTGATEKPEANEGNGDGSAGGVITNAVTGLALFLGSIWPWVSASALLMLIGVLWIKRRQNASRD